MTEKTSSTVHTGWNHVATRQWHPSTNMLSVLPDGAEPRGSNRESCCSRTSVSWHPLTFCCRTPLHCIWKHEPPSLCPITTVAGGDCECQKDHRGKCLFSLFTRSSAILCVLVREGQSVLSTEEFSSRMFARSWAQGQHGTLKWSFTLKCNHKLSYIPQGPAYFFPGRSRKCLIYSGNISNIWERAANKTQQQKMQQGASLSMTAWLNSSQRDACWKVYRPLLNGPLAEMDETQWWQINAASYLMAPHVNSPAHHQVQCLCCSSWLLQWPVQHKTPLW